MGIVVEVSFSTEKLSLLRIWCWVQVVERQLVRIFVRIFRVVSNRVIGLVLVRSPSHWSFFGIRMMMACFQTCGMSACLMHWFRRLRRIWSRDGGAFFQISFGILDELGLLLLDMVLMVFSSSSKLIGSIRCSKCWWCGWW